jgi:hypothetical protein
MEMDAEARIPRQSDIEKTQIGELTSPHISIKSNESGDGMVNVTKLAHGSSESAGQLPCEGRMMLRRTQGSPTLQQLKRKRQSRSMR